MAKTAKSVYATVKSGDFVYLSFQIMKPGKVLSVLPNGRVEIKWLDGTTSTENAHHLNCFNHATDLHLSKYQKFDAMRQKLSKV